MFLFRLNGLMIDMMSQGKGRDMGDKMDTKRNYLSELAEFVSDNRVTKGSVIDALYDLIAACEEHDEMLNKLSSGNGCFADTLARIMDELTPKV